MRALLTTIATAVLSTALLAQGPAPAGRGQAPPGARGPQAIPPTPRASAPIDLTGNWVAVIGEDWRWRMVTPARGDYSSIPITQAAKDAADRWDPARDTAAGEQCRSYGAPGLMRAPTRLRISWQDDTTLKVESDYGQQTRLLRFGPAAAPGPASWQGQSVASWETPARGRGRGAAPTTGNLKVVTTNLRPGYLRKNGVPYGNATVYTEYWDLFGGAQTGVLVVTSIVHDPANLQIDWITSLNFRKEPDGSKWDPTPCSATW